MRNNFILLTIITSLSILLAACGTQPESEPDFSVISSPELPALSQATPTLPEPTPVPEEPTAPPPTINPTTGPSLFDIQPATVLPDTPTPLPTDTPEIVETPINTPEPVDTPTTAPPTATPKPVSPPAEPLQGGSWDMEDGFEIWLNPYGDDCSGSKIAVGWRAFTSRGQYGSSCFYLNDYGPNVFSGGHSQLVTFDFVDSQAGLYRVLDTTPGHTYQVTARLRHVHTLPPMQYHFGVDLSANTNWEVDTVQWTQWAEFREDEWITHQQTFTATDAKTTIFIKGSHATAAQGGATYIDAIEVVDLG